MLKATKAELSWAKDVTQNYADASGELSPDEQVAEIARDFAGYRQELLEPFEQLAEDIFDRTSISPFEAAKAIRELVQKARGVW